MLLLFISVYPQPGETCKNYLDRCKKNKINTDGKSELYFKTYIFLLNTVNY